MYLDAVQLASFKAVQFTHTLHKIPVLDSLALHLTLEKLETLQTKAGLFHAFMACQPSSGLRSIPM